MTSRSIASISILALLLTSTPVVAIAQTLTGRVVSVGDGDTLRVTTGGKTVTVRLACVDAPETAQAPFGKAATDRLRQLLPPSQQITLVTSHIECGNISGGGVNANIQRKTQSGSERDTLKPLKAINGHSLVL
jgi:hypothetical protein